MTTTKTEDISATTEQIKRLETAGCKIVRLAVPSFEAAKALGRIKERVGIPVVADIHFSHKLAVESVAAGADKIRINPGNIGDAGRVKAVADACRRANVPIRVGVNSGSLEKKILAKYGHTPEAMFESAMGHAALLNRFDFDDICISVKASNVKLTVDAYRLLAEKTDYPLHLGVTEAGGAYMGVIKSSVGMGALLLGGIGDTLRVSLTADPVEEVYAGKAILKAAGRIREGVDVISCPSCGRCKIDLIGITKEVEARLADCTRTLTVAVMGCSVNGPGEAAAADFGIAGGDGAGLLFQRGEILGKVPMERLVDRLIDLIDKEGEA